MREVTAVPPPVGLAEWVLGAQAHVLGFDAFWEVVWVKPHGFEAPAPLNGLGSRHQLGRHGGSSGQGDEDRNLHLGIG